MYGKSLLPITGEARLLLEPTKDDDGRQGPDRRGPGLHLKRLQPHRIRSVLKRITRRVHAVQLSPKTLVALSAASAGKI